MKILLVLISLILFIGCCPKNESKKIEPILEQVKDKVISYKKRTGNYPIKDKDQREIITSIGCKHISGNMYECKNENYGVILSNGLDGNKVNVFYIEVMYNDTSCILTLKEKDMSIIRKNCALPTCGKM